MHPDLLEDFAEDLRAQLLATSVPPSASVSVPALARRARRRRSALLASRATAAVVLASVAVAVLELGTTARPDVVVDRGPVDEVERPTSRVGDEVPWPALDRTSDPWRTPGSAPGAVDGPGDGVQVGPARRHDPDPGDPPSDPEPAPAVTTWTFDDGQEWRERGDVEVGMDGQPPTFRQGARPRTFVHHPEGRVGHGMRGQWASHSGMGRGGGSMESPPAVAAGRELGSVGLWVRWAQAGPANATLMVGLEAVPSPDERGLPRRSLQLGSVGRERIGAWHWVEFPFDLAKFGHPDDHDARVTVVVSVRYDSAEPSPDCLGPDDVCAPLMDLDDVTLTFTD